MSAATAPYPTTVEEWRVFLTGVRRDMLQAYATHVLHEPLPVDLIGAPLSYLEDLYVVSPVKSLEAITYALMKPRAARPNFFTNRERYKRLRQFEQECDWIRDTAGSIRNLGWDNGRRHSLEQYTVRVMAQKDAFLMSDLKLVQKRIMYRFISLVLMLEEIDFCSDQVLAKENFLTAAERYYAQWLPRYEELLAQGF